MRKAVELIYPGSVEKKAEGARTNWMELTDSTGRSWGGDEKNFAPSPPLDRTSKFQTGYQIRHAFE